MSITVALGAGCPSGRSDDDAASSSISGPPTSSGTSADGGASDGGDGDGGPKLDVGADDVMPGPVDMCKVNPDGNAVGECEEQAPPDSFEPEVQWDFTDAMEPFSYVTPLVVNMTDDNDDGAIDLCDIPDVVLVAGANPGGPNNAGHIFVLSGDDGSLHFRIETDVDSSFTPALGDIDGDGVIEIVTADPTGNLVAFEHDGTPKWAVPTVWPTGTFGQTLQYSNSAALADVDNDGDVEIMSANLLADHMGATIQSFPELGGQWGATVAADLDGDMDLEIVLGHAAFHHDGTPLFVTALEAGYPQVADLDADGRPEVVLTNANGVSLIEHDGTVTYQDMRPTMDPPGGTTWLRPATIHDFDGDSQPEFAVSSASHYTVYEPDASIVWTADVDDSSGIAAGTAFDFLGDGIAEAMYADQQFMYVFDGMGGTLLQVSRQSGTLSEYPTVVDVDNDGSAEILFVSNNFLDGSDPCLQVIRDIDDRWIQARRIWNQHPYHVTNVREDGTIPQFEQPHWEALNTFRTNAQIEGGGLCVPPPPG